MNRFNSVDREIMKSMHVSEFYPYTYEQDKRYSWKTELKSYSYSPKKQKGHWEYYQDDELHQYIEDYPKRAFMIDIDGIVVRNKEMGFSTRVLNCLQEYDMGINELNSLNKQDLLRKLNRFGKTSVENLQDVLTAWGFTRIHFRFLDTKIKRNTRERKYIDIEETYLNEENVYLGMNNFLRTHEPNIACYIHPVDLEKYGLWGWPLKFQRAYKKYKENKRCSILWRADGSLSVIPSPCILNSEPDE